MSLSPQFCLRQPRSIAGPHVTLLGVGETLAGARICGNRLGAGRSKPSVISGIQTFAQNESAFGQEGRRSDKDRSFVPQSKTTTVFLNREVQRRSMLLPARSRAPRSLHVPLPTQVSFYPSRKIRREFCKLDYQSFFECKRGQLDMRTRIRGERSF